MKILVTGGCGYIGSHTAIELIASGHDVVAADNLSNSNKEALERVEEITGEKIPFYEIDCRNRVGLQRVFTEHRIDAVIHFAGFKSVGESMADPLRYYRNNLDATLTLCDVMQEHGVYKLIFSSSCTVYGVVEQLPIDETTPAGTTIISAYGRTKFMSEQILKDLSVSNPKWQVVALRYFNVVGAHPSGRIGEDPNGIPNFLLPYITQVAVGKLEKLRVFGNDYDTPDGTCLRDYIHVVDLAKGHIASLNHLPKSGVEVYNLGTGRGVSVLELIGAFEKASGKKIPYKIVGRRPGDAPAAYADCSKANKKLHWKATRTIEDACIDSWRWQSTNPNGYRD